MLKKFSKIGLAAVTFSLLSVSQLSANSETFQVSLFVAKRGDVEAQFAVAQMYETGQNVDQDRTKAIEWYRKAAEQGHQGAIQKLSSLSAQPSVAVESEPEVAGSVATGDDPLFAQIASAVASHVSEEAEEEGQSGAASQAARSAASQAALEKQRKLEAERRAEEQRKAEEKHKKEAQMRVAEKKKHDAAEKKRLAEEAEKAEKERLAALQLDSLKKVGASKWLLGERPAAHLPSQVVSCKPRNKGELVCWSKEFTIKKADVGSYKVKVKSFIRDWDKNGFKVIYRNLVIAGDGVAPRGDAVSDGELGAVGGIKLGWEKETHQLRCRIDSYQKIVCKGFDPQPIVYARVLPK